MDNDDTSYPGVSAEAIRGYLTSAIGKRVDVRSWPISDEPFAVADVWKRIKSRRAPRLYGL